MPYIKVGDVMMNGIVANETRAVCVLTYLVSQKMVSASSVMPFYGTLVNF